MTNLAMLPMLTIYEKLDYVRKPQALLFGVSKGDKSII